MLYYIIGRYSKMKKFKLTILHSSDTHGYVYPYLYANMQPFEQGIAKLKTAFDEHKTSNTLMIDTGDTIQGSPLTYYHAKFNNDEVNPIAKAFNHIGYDYVAIGNHEFNYGRKYMDGFFHHLDAKILCANITYKETNSPIYGVPYSIQTFENGPTIALIGVTTHYIPNWELPDHIKDLNIQDAFDTLQNTVEHIKENHQTDYIIALYHGGFERDLETGELESKYTSENQGYMMIDQIEGIDLLLTGHQHRLLSGKLKNTYYIQPSCNGQHFGKATIDFTNEESNWSHQTVVNTYPINSYQPSSEILEITMDNETKTQEWLDKQIGTLKFGDLLMNDPLEDRLHKHPLASFINQVQLEYSGAMISCCSFGNNVSGFKQEISMRDVASTYIFPNTLVVKELDGFTLKRNLEKTATFFELENETIVISPRYNHPKLQLYAYDMYDGINYTINLSKPHGERVENISINDKPLEMSQTYTVVMNNYRASGGGDYHWLKEAKTVKDIQVDVVEIIINYILKHKEIDFKHNQNITIKVR